MANKNDRKQKSAAFVEPRNVDKHVRYVCDWQGAGYYHTTTLSDGVVLLEQGYVESSNMGYFCMQPCCPSYKQAGVLEGTAVVTASGKNGRYYKDVQHVHALGVTDAQLSKRLNIASAQMIISLRLAHGSTITKICVD